MVRKDITAACAVASLLITAALPSAVYAETTMRVLGGFSNQYQNSHIEKPFFEGIEQATQGAISATFRSIDELGLRGYDAFRQLQSGMFDVMAISPGYVAGDDPFVLGIDLPGIATEIEVAHAAVEAFREPLSERVRERFQGELLAIWPYPAQMFFCKGTLKSLDDLTGKKVRVFSPTLGALVEHFGGSGVTLAFSEVYQSLQRGLIDCAITASLSGNDANWFEVTDTIYSLPISWAIQLHVANGDFWRSLSVEDQATIMQQFTKMEAQMWTAAARTTQDGVNCNTGAEPCELGTPANMSLTSFTENDRSALIDAVKAAVLPAWGKECEAAYADCIPIWNETVGKVTGYTAD